MSSIASKRRSVALVTGGASGVGAATCLALARKGFDVALNYHTKAEAVESVATGCREAGAEPLLLRGDVGEDADCRAMVAATIERFGRLDALVNNAAISPKGAGGSRLSAFETELADWQTIFQVNFFAPMMLARGLIAELEKAHGSIVNVTSIAGARVPPFAGAA